MTAPGAAELPLRQPTAAAVSSGRSVRRIHIMGGPGSGKTTLAERIAASAGLPVHHLDDIARVGGGEGRLRSAPEREPLIDAILAEDGWITEGVQLGWTDAFLQRAEVIVWLDYVSWPRAARRLVRRFVSGAACEMRNRPGREKVARIDDYVRSLRSLGSAVSQSRRYYASVAEETPGANIPSPVSATLDSRAATVAALGPFRAKLVRCRCAADVDAFARTVQSAGADP